MSETPLPDGRVAKWILLMTLLFALAARLAAGQGPTAAEPPGDLYQKAKQASVEILVDDHLDGSGWFADPKGLVFTAAHVVGRPGRRVEVLSPVAGRLEAKVVAVDLGHDLILLEVDPREGGYPALPLAEKPPAAGQDIYLFGAPIFRTRVLLRGMIARDDTVFEYYAGRYVETMHVAATVQPGTSGGPWLNRASEVVGLQSGVMSQNSIPVGVANIIPVGTLRSVLERRCNGTTPTIGAAVEELWQQPADVLKRFPPRTEGLIVKILQKDRPAARAGLKQWDLIVAADGQTVRRSGELLGIIRVRQPGDELKLTVVGPDGTGTREATVRLGQLEVGWPEANKANKDSNDS